MIPVSFLAEAEVELWEAIEYYEDRCFGLGLDFATEIESSIEVIAHSPRRFPIREDGTRRCLTRRFPYVIVFLTLDPQILIVAIAHAKRKSAYWEERIDS